MEGQIAGHPSVDGGGRIEHERSRSGDDAAGFVIVASLHDITLFAEFRSLGCVTAASSGGDQELTASVANRVRKRRDLSPVRRLTSSRSAMDLDREACYRAVKARDRRFDGRFFTGVLSTGIF